MNTAPIVMILTKVLTTVSVIHDYINTDKKKKKKRERKKVSVVTHFQLTISQNSRESVKFVCC